MPQIVFAAFLFPTDFTDNTDFRPARSEVIVTLISQMTQIFDLFGLRFHRFCFWEKVIFCSSLQYRSALVIFQKPTRPSLPLKKDFFYLSVSPARRAPHPNQAFPSRKGKDVTALCAVFLKSSRPSLPLKKAPPLISVFSPQGRRGKPPSGARNRYAIRLTGHQSPRHGCAGWDRLTIACYGTAGLLLGTA